MEELDLTVAPLALAVEQEHATCLVDFATAAAEPLRDSRPGMQGIVAGGAMVTVERFDGVCQELARSPQACADFTAGEGRTEHEPALEALSGGASRASTAQQKVYIEHAVLSSIDASLSFVPAPWTASRSSGMSV